MNVTELWSRGCPGIARISIENGIMRVACLVEETNLLANPGFEEGLQVHWRQAIKSGTALFGWSDLAYSGLKSASIFTSGGQARLVSDPVPSAPGKKYQLGCWAQTQGGMAELAVSWRAAGNYLAWGGQVSIEGAHDWTYLALNVGPAPEGADSLEVLLRNWGGNGTAWFDDVSLEEVV